jgi:hypothetical protein
MAAGLERHIGCGATRAIACHGERLSFGMRDPAFSCRSDGNDAIIFRQHAADSRILAGGAQGPQSK